MSDLDLDLDDGIDEAEKAERRRRRWELARRVQLLPAGLLPLEVGPDGEFVLDPRMDRAIVAAVCYGQAADFSGEFGQAEGESLIADAVKLYVEALVDLALICTGLMCPEIGPGGPRWVYRPDSDPQGRRAASIRNHIRGADHDPR